MPTAPNLIPIAPVPTSHLGIIVSNPVPTGATTILVTSQGNATRSVSMQSAIQDLRPIPPAATEVGNGHHEISEPDFSATRPCRGCSPVIEITATGWLDKPAEQQHDPTPLTTKALPKATISAGTASLIVEQGPDGDNFVVGGSYTIAPGKTLMVDNTPVEIRTSDGKTVAVMGTTVIPLQPDHPQTTYGPMQPPPILSVGTATITPNSQLEYVIEGQTLIPGGEPLTISGTTLSLAPSATVLVVNGETSSIVPGTISAYTTVVPAAFTFHSQVYTANRAGYIIMGPGTTLIPGGNAATIDGTTLSLEPSGSAVVVQGSTISLQPATTVVTLTKEPNTLGTRSSGSDPTMHSTGITTSSPTANATNAGAVRYNAAFNGWLGCVLLLVWWSIGCSALRL